MKTTIALFFLSFLLFISCGQKENNDKANTETTTKTDTEKKEELEKNNRLRDLNIISKQFGASATFDTVWYETTYQYQNLLKQNNHIIIDGNRCRITDIEKIDSNFVVSVEKGDLWKILIEFICTKSQIKKLYPDSLNPSILNVGFVETLINNKYLVLKINDIKKIKFKIDANTSEHGDDGTTAYVEMRHSQAFICKGELIDIYLKPKQ